jgi:hypothetical protein
VLAVLDRPVVPGVNGQEAGADQVRGQAGEASSGTSACVEAARADSFTEVDAGDTAPVQVMNLHQTKGREADAVIAVFREDDYHGKETEPFPAASRLLYVILTRARHQVTLLLPTRPHALVEPFCDAHGTCHRPGLPHADQIRITMGRDRTAASAAGVCVAGSGHGAVRTHLA